VRICAYICVLTGEHEQASRALLFGWVACCLCLKQLVKQQANADSYS
jgi:hypothetical protein